MIMRRVLCLPACSMFLTACAAGTVPLNEVLNYGNCSGLEAGIREVTLDEVARLRGMTMFGGETEGGAATPVDQQGMPKLVAISKGPQPSAGYAIVLKEGRMEDEALAIEVEWKEPPADAMTAQVISHPCLVVGLPDPAPQKVIVRTSNGEEIGRLTFTP
jgi:hypothetical protein